MWSIEQPEDAIKAHYFGGWTYGEISKEMNIPSDTIKTSCRRYREANGVPTLSDGDIKIKRSYKPCEKSSDKIRDERIAQLETEVELLRNFLLMDERGQRRDLYIV